jgi:hypothetical protein
MTDYTGALLKIGRAQTHMAELDYAVFRYLRQRRYSISLIQDFETDRAGFELTLKEAPPLEIGVMLGDAVHNLRAALDHVIAANALAAGKTAKGTAFPIGKDRADFEQRALDSARKAGPEAIAVCTDLKPYRGGNDALVDLHELDIVDKHQLLIGVAAAGHFGGRYLKRLGDPQISIGHRVHFFGPEPQFVPAPTGYEGQIPSEIGLAVEIVFPPDGPMGGMPCVATLVELADIVKGVVETFKSRCP